MTKTKYELSWTDSLLGKSVIKMIKERPDIEISTDGVIDFQAKHTFEADTDEEAKKYAAEYDFGGYDDVSCYNVCKGDEIIATEEDI